jgi:hypothetical protein
MIGRVVCIFVLLALASCASNGPSGLSSSQRAQIVQIDLSLKLVSERQFAEAEAVIRPLIHAKGFGRLPSAEQYRALLTAAKLAFTLKEPKLEYESRVRLLALPEATGDDRMSRLNAATRLNDTSEKLASLTDLALKNPERLDHMNYQFILRVLNESEKQLPHGAALPLMQALYTAHWKVVLSMEPSGTWQDLALLLLEQNRLSEAIDVSTHVTDEYALIAMRSDRRFDAISASNPAQFDVNAAIRNALNHFQALAERTPNPWRLSWSFWSAYWSSNTMAPDWLWPTRWWRRFGYMRIPNSGTTTSTNGMCGYSIPGLDCCSASVGGMKALIS